MLFTLRCAMSNSVYVARLKFRFGNCSHGTHADFLTVRPPLRRLRGQERASGHFDGPKNATRRAGRQPQAEKRAGTLKDLREQQRARRARSAMPQSSEAGASDSQELAGGHRRRHEAGFLGRRESGSSTASDGADVGAQAVGQRAIVITDSESSPVMLTSVPAVGQGAGAHAGLVLSLQLPPLSSCCLLREHAVISCCRVRRL